MRVAPAVHSLGLVVGGIAQKPAVVAGRIEPREILKLSVAFGHDVVDVAPAARFVRRLIGALRVRHLLKVYRLAIREGKGAHHGREPARRACLRPADQAPLPPRLT
jgi:2-oxoacid dehydrogenases acyltransferase (catalytic domain)